MLIIDPVTCGADQERRSVHGWNVVHMQALFARLIFTEEIRPVTLSSQSTWCRIYMPQQKMWQTLWNATNPRKPPK